MKTNPLSIKELYLHIKTMLLYHGHSYGLCALFMMLIFLSFLSGLPYGQTPALFVTGEIATQTVIAKRDFLIEDEEGTKERKAKIRAIQPLVFDYNPEVATRVREGILNLIHTINTLEINNDEEGLKKIQEQFNKTYLTHLDFNTFKTLAQTNTQEYTFETLLPWIDNQMVQGILSDNRILFNTTNTIIIRDRNTKMERVRSISNGLLDLHALTVAMGNKIRAEQSLSEEARSALLKIFPYFLAPTLALNQEETNQKINSLLATVKPIYFQVHNGEIIVREGDLVTRETQLKLQTIYNSSEISFNFYRAMGSFILGFMLTLGLFMTPSGQKGRILHSKDQVFIALLVSLVGCLSFALAHFGHSISSELDTSLLPYAFPVAGIAGLAVLIFSARRYCILGFLIAFFSSLLFQGDVALFLYYFISTMVNTWLILRSQSRQDVVLSIIPLFLILILIGLGTALMQHLIFTRYLTLFIMITTNAILSILILFALSPVLELIFGYTTRFRLMELMNLDHPLLQEIMMNTPGTYHHCLVVSNLVEAGAKAIGANSLLAKVGALYHDIGKIAHPHYFSENQFDGINPHDKLSPRMSCLIIFSHVKNGVELAEKYKLGQEITDMISQHHGTRMPMAFFLKAKKLGEEPKEEDYRYAGPRPQTKEAAILMMADTLEAAIRSIPDPSPARISSTVETLVKNIYAEGQLDEADLTFKDLNKLIESFTRTLRALNHQRVAYPQIQNLQDKDKNKTKEEKIEKSTEEKIEPPIKNPLLEEKQLTNNEEKK